MKEFIDINPDINVEETEYKRLLGYPSDYQIDGRAVELSQWAREWYNKNGKPWIYAVKVDSLDLSGEKLIIKNIEFSSLRLRKQLFETEVKSVILLAVTAGKELEEKAYQLWKEEKPDEYFFLEIYGSAVVEHLVTTAGFKFCEWAEENNLALLPHYSPGYTGWNIEDQNKLFRLILEERNSNLPGEFSIFESGMLNPKKSLIALLGLTNQIDKVKNLKELSPCQSCSMRNCKYRRRAYKYSGRQIEDVNKFQSNKNNNSSNNFYDPVLTKNAKYNVSTKTLQKWSDERLQLKISEDNSVEAKFRYEGTTCSNMGRSLEFIYTIKLGSPLERYKIKELDCSPAKGNNGYTLMCEYINDSETLMSSIEREKPLLGKPFDEILKWKRPFNPEGCYCKSESREHKWGIVFEVLHFAIANSQKKLIPVKQE